MQSSNEMKKEKPDPEATSDQLLSDVEEEEASVESGSSAPDPGPSPDGALDESNETKEAGPM